MYIVLRNTILQQKLQVWFVNPINGSECFHWRFAFNSPSKGKTSGAPVDIKRDDPWLKVFHWKIPRQNTEVRWKETSWFHEASGRGEKNGGGGCWIVAGTQQEAGSARLMQPSFLTEVQSNGRKHRGAWPDGGYLSESAACGVTATKRKRRRVDPTWTQLLKPP